MKPGPALTMKGNMKKIIDFVKTWRDSNITDELQPEVLKADSRDLLEKIEEMEGNNETSHTQS